MKAQQIVDRLTERAGCVCEATVRRPPRGRIWVATFTGIEPGRQVWRSTGTANYHEALLQARAWEREALRERQAKGLGRAKAAIRAHRQQQRTGTEAGPLSQRDVATILHMSERAVRNIERRALAKLFRHPRLRQIWREYLAGELAETNAALSPEERTAIWGLARTAQERQALGKLLALAEDL